MRNRWNWAFGFLIIGISLGWVIAFAAIEYHPTLTLSTIMAKGPDTARQFQEPSLELKINYLLVDYSEKILAHLQHVYDNDEDINFSANQLEANNQQLANLVSRVYGEQGREMFIQMWKEHNLALSKYAQGLREGDEKTQREAKEKLESLNLQMEQTIKEINPEYPVTDLKALLDRHNNLILETIKDYSTKERSKLADLEKELSNQAAKISEFIVTH